MTQGRSAHEGLTFVALGTNLGDRVGHLVGALQALDAEPDISIVAQSSIYETAPVGLIDQPAYLNAVAGLETPLSPFDLLKITQRIEQQFHRERGVRWGPRTLDLDILLSGATVLQEPNLTVPHPRMLDRRFVMVPLAEIAPDVIHPIAEKRIDQLLADLPSEDGDVVVFETERHALKVA